LIEKVTRFFASVNLTLSTGVLARLEWTPGHLIGWLLSTRFPPKILANPIGRVTKDLALGLNQLVSC
jgi:hypothetical protein